MVVSHFMKHTIEQIIFSFLLLMIIPLLSPTHAADTGYWHTNENKIVNENGQVVRITGVNWFGMETDSYGPHGLWARNYKEMIDQIKQLGYNTIRLPFSNQMLESGTTPNGIDYTQNPDLKDLSSQKVMDKIIDYAGKIGLKIILDRHRPEASGQSELWYTNRYSEQRWIDDWRRLANRYYGNSTVIGFDLHNEPHGSACWGCGDTSKDWSLAAQKAGNAVLAVNPNLLIFVEGIEQYNNNWYWWGGNLMGVKDHPITLNVSHQLVYSTHDYPNSVWTQSWFNDSSYPNNLPTIWDKYWGYIAKNKIAPIYVGEYGTKLQTNADKQWLNSLLSYMGNDTNALSWTYWSWNPNSGDTGGILQDDWKTVNSEKQNFISPLLSTISIPTAQPSVQPTTLPPSTFTPTISVPPSSPPTSTPTLTLIPSPTPTLASPIPLTPTQAIAPSPSVVVPTTSGATCKVFYFVSDQWNEGFVAHVTVLNMSNSPVKNWTVSFNFDGNQKIISLWNGNQVQNDKTVTVKDAGWNEVINPNNSTTFGFVGSYSGTNNNPREFTLNNVKCE